MLDKTKATMPGRQCSTENREQNQHTRPAAGGQILSAPEITGTAPLARFTPVLAFTPWRGTALQHTQSPEFSVATISQIVGCILNTRQYFPQWGECEPVAHTLFLRTALGCVQILPLCSPVLANSNIECRGQRNFAPADFIQDFGSSFAFWRWRRLISPRIEVTINPALLSPSSLSDSISATTSCGTRTVKSCDFAFLLEVAITDSFVIWCVSVYAKKTYAQCLKCVSLECSFKSEGETHLVNNEARQCSNTNRASDHNVIGANNMADLQHTQTRPEFTWLFLATPKHYPECAPVVIRFDADTESSARAAFPGWELVFAAKIRAQAPCRVSFFDYSTRRGWEFDSAASQGVRHA